MSSLPHLSMYLSRSLCCSYIWSMIILQSSITLQSSRKPSPSIPPTGNGNQGLVLVRLNYSSHPETLPALFLPTVSAPETGSTDYNNNCRDTTTKQTNHALPGQGQTQRKAGLGLFTDAISFVSL